jgi:hypothetical protein
MAEELEYIVNTALTHCDKGMAMLPFTSTINTTVHIQKQLVATEMDKIPLVNIPSYGMCSATKSPCNPAPTVWDNTYEFVKVKTFKPLLFKSCMQCGKGGKIEFLTSGQLPLADSVDAESVEQIEDANKQSQEAVEEFEAQKDAVGESGLVEGFIPVWGSGRDAVNSFQTGHWGWGIFHCVMVVVDVATLGIGSIVKGAVKGVVKAGVKATLKQAGKAALEGLTKKAIAAVAAKEAAVALIKNTGKMAAEFSVKRLGVCIAKACFVAGTPVATKDGLKNIEDLVSGDEVWAYNEQTGETALKPILNAFEREADAIIKLVVDEEEIETTPEHPFFVDGVWKEAGLIEIGNTVQLLNGKAAIVKNIIHKFDYELQPTIAGEDVIEEDYQLTKVFNIEVEAWHTYFVGKKNVLVHNMVCVREVVEGILKGKKILLEGFTKESMLYIKRSKEGLDDLRKAFNSKERGAFLKKIAGDSENIKKLKDAGITDDQLKLLKDGKVPDGYQVHHKKPIDDGGDNSFDNLVLIKNDPYHKSLTNLQNDLTRGMKSGDSKVIEWPVVDGFIYPK